MFSINRTDLWQLEDRLLDLAEVNNLKITISYNIISCYQRRNINYSYFALPTWLHEVE
jgi:hypothetical protein